MAIMMVFGWMPMWSRTCGTFVRHCRRRTGGDSQRSRRGSWGMAASGTWPAFWGAHAGRSLVGSKNSTSCRTIRLLVASGDRVPVEKKDRAGLRCRAESQLPADDPDGWRPGRFHSGVHRSVSENVGLGTHGDGNTRERPNDSGVDGGRRLEGAENQQSSGRRFIARPEYAI